MEKYKDRPIGVFDSGQGGLTVLSRLVDLLPHENFVFYGDSGNAPYGVRTKEEVYQLSKRVVEHLINDHQVKAIMIACNTATSAAAARLRAEYELPIIGIEPAAKPAVLENPDQEVVVMATPLTLRESKFNNLLQKYDKDHQVVKVPAPKLVELIEQGQTKSPELYSYLHQVLDPYAGKASAVVLGCTHFPFAKQAILDVLGPQTRVYDGAIGAANEVKHQLAKRDQLTERTEAGRIIFENSAPGASALSEELYQLFRSEN